MFITHYHDASPGYVRSVQSVLSCLTVCNNIRLCQHVSTLNSDAVLCYRYCSHFLCVFPPRVTRTKKLVKIGHAFPEINVDRQTHSAAVPKRLKTSNSIRLCQLVSDVASRYHYSSRLLVCRSAVHSRAASDDHPGRPAVPQRAQDFQQHPTLSTGLHAHQCLVHRSWIRTPSQYTY